jgi:hypothetical protein
MKVIKHENGIELVPESESERQCLKHIDGKKLTVTWTDAWERMGNLKIEFPSPDDWGS